MSEPTTGTGLSSDLLGKLEKAMDKILVDNTKFPESERLTKEEYDLRVEYTRLSWRLFSQIGPSNFSAQSNILAAAMALHAIRGGDEAAFVNTIIKAMVDSNLAPKEGA